MHDAVRMDVRAAAVDTQYRRNRSPFVRERLMSRPEAIETLEALGLTEYEARCFVGLTQLSDGTAKEISQVADVPQSRVYDVVDDLHQRGLVDIQESKPRRYFAVPVNDALGRLREDYDTALEAADDQLQRLESRETDSESVWQVATNQDVLLRLTRYISEATSYVYLLVADDAMVDEDVLETLAEVLDAGVSVYVEVPSDDARENLHDTVPDAEVAVTDLPLEAMPDSDRKPGRLLLVDGETVLLTATQGGLVPGDTEESGMWGRDGGHGLVVWMRSLLKRRRERIEFERRDAR